MSEEGIIDHLKHHCVTDRYLHTSTLLWNQNWLSTLAPIWPHNSWYWGHSILHNETNRTVDHDHKGLKSYVD